MSSSLPPGWEKVLDRNSGQYYFYNARLGVTQWDPPQVGAQKTKATFVTTTTRKTKVVRKPQPLAYQHRPNPAYTQPVHTRTVQHTTTSHVASGRRVAYGNGGCLCNSGDAIFLSSLAAIVILIVVLFSTVGAGTIQNGSIGGGAYNPPSNNNNNNNNNGGGDVAASGCGVNDGQCVELAELVKLVNKHRVSIGAVEMTSNTMLNKAAQRHSCYMAEYKVMSHTGGPQASDRELIDRIANTGYHYQAAGENVASGQTTAKNVMKAWLNSPGHRRNIESTDFDEIGVGLRESDNGGNYWTQVFGKQQTTARQGRTNDACLRQLPGL